MLSLTAYLNERFQFSYSVANYASLYATLASAIWHLQIRPAAGSPIINLDFMTGGSPQNAAATATYNATNDIVVFKCPSTLVNSLEAGTYYFDFGFTLPGDDFERVDGGTIVFSSGVTIPGIAGTPPAPVGSDDTVTGGADPTPSPVPITLTSALSAANSSAMAASASAVTASNNAGAATTQASNAAASASASAASAASIAGGPVASVNGMTGAVTGVEVTSHKGAANGYASLDSGGLVPAAQIPLSASTDLADSTALGRSLITAASIAAAQSALALSPKGFFFKADATTPAFSVTGTGTISLKAGTIAECAGAIFTYASATAVTMPSLAAGTDYAIYQCSDGTIRADASFTAPTGYTTTNSRQIGGFHYAPGGNAAAMAGGNTTPAINPYSVWDLKFRPRCVDPRGMALVAGRFWCDIYLTNTATDANGSSRYGLAIASGSVPPKIPAAFGGNGSTAYGQFNWWDANETLASVGKRLLLPAEFQIAAYGTTEETSLSADPVTTGLQAGTYTSKWGLFQATGCYWVWGRELGGPYSAASWAQSTGNRGEFYNMPNAVILGGDFGFGADSGSRASGWFSTASYTNGTVGARGCCDHIMIA